MKLKVTVTKGGPGSGNFGHAGRPGRQGGSAAGAGGSGGGKWEPTKNTAMNESMIMENGKPKAIMVQRADGKWTTTAYNVERNGALHTVQHTFRTEDEARAFGENPKATKRFNPVETGKTVQQSVDKLANSTKTSHAAYTDREKAALLNTFSSSSKKGRRVNEDDLNSPDMLKSKSIPKLLKAGHVKKLASGAYELTASGTKMMRDLEDEFGDASAFIFH